MIHIFSSEFKLDILDEAALTILIEDICRLKLHKTDKETYYFTGNTEDSLTTVAILDNLGLDNLGIEIFVSDILCKITTNVTYFEVDLETLQVSATKVNKEYQELAAEDNLFDVIYNFKQ